MPWHFSSRRKSWLRKCISPHPRSQWRMKSSKLNSWRLNSVLPVKEKQRSVRKSDPRHRILCHARKSRKKSPSSKRRIRRGKENEYAACQIIWLNYWRLPKIILDSSDKLISPHQSLWAIEVVWSKISSLSPLFSRVLDAVTNDTLGGAKFLHYLQVFYRIRLLMMINKHFRSLAHTEAWMHRLKLLPARPRSAKEMGKEIASPHSSVKHWMQFKCSASLAVRHWTHRVREDAL